MEIKEIINKAKREMVKHINAISYDKTLTSLARSFVCVLCDEFNCTTWSDVYCFIEENTTFEIDRRITASENINNFIKSYNNHLEIE